MWTRTAATANYKKIDCRGYRLKCVQEKLTEQRECLWQLPGIVLHTEDPFGLIQYLPSVVLALTLSLALLLLIIVFSSLMLHGSVVVHLQSSNTHNWVHIIITYYIIYSVQFSSFRLVAALKCSLLWMSCVPYGLLPPNFCSHWIGLSSQLTTIQKM